MALRYQYCLCCAFLLIIIKMPAKTHYNRPCAQPKGWQNKKLQSELLNSKIRQLEVLVSLLETGTLVHCWWECKVVQSLGRAIWQLSSRVENANAYKPAISLQGIYPTKTGTCTQEAMFVIEKAGGGEH